MRHSLLTLLLLAASAVVLPPSTASAQAGRPRLNAQQRRQAKRLFDQGMLAYRRGDYEEAILRWQESYEISRHPLTFEAIANAYEKLDNYEAALEYLVKWRQSAPRREHEVLDARIEHYQRQLAKQKAERDRTAAEQKRLQEEARRKAEADQRQRQLQQTSKVRPLMIAGWTLVGTGAAAIITGIALDGVAAGQRPDEAQACRESSEGLLLCSDDDRAAINNSNIMAIAGDALWIGGAALAAGGAALLIVDALAGGSKKADSGPPKGSARVIPLVGPRLLGAGVSLQF